MLSFHTVMLLGFTPHRTLYPTTRALQTGTLPVTEPHKLYYEVHGKAGGAPALFLHGGPGAGCAVRHAGFFDPKHYQIVLFDQRGCGRSTPTGELQDNNAAELVQDCERLREHLGFDRVARGFVNAEGLLSTAVPRIREARIPCIAVHGANDLICPPLTAYELHEAWPEMELRVVPGAGHSMYDSQLQAEVLRATDLLRTVGAVSTPGPTQSVAPSMVAP
ncbi:proline iminopeptidase [Chrysochromulina tobinii]|uniref:prolyl aminopeptidase n=1 Tax=Chrysochromulina tobinii TaxID=1460289 RepID=A0A0M0JSI6_9EUKA|nr:proline iminopeptidase [Chrysochromulina tobinii]|eukprot:KOO29534.1 proline iminopeptidase [Chrysochromulina sp. CCMP291]